FLPSTVYTLCDPKLVERNEGKLYDLYVLSFQNFASSKVLPSLKGKKGVELLQELLKRWEGHKIMARWLSRVFHYLNRYYLPRKALPSLMEASHSVFHDLVYSEMNGDIMDAVLSLVDRERDGERIDKSLMKEVVHIYVEMGEGSMKYYVRDFEPGLLDSTSAYYSKKSQERIETTDYEAKVKECLIQEKARVSEYLEYKSLNRICEVCNSFLICCF
ncbi:hypothetical protein M569_07118, partial [Genlisea aurea]